MHAASKKLEFVVVSVRLFHKQRDEVFFRLAVVHQRK